MGLAEHTDLCPLSVPTQSLARSTRVTACEEPRDTGLPHPCGRAARHRTGVGVGGESEEISRVPANAASPFRPWETLRPQTSERCPCLPDFTCGTQGVSVTKTEPEENCGGGGEVPGCLWPEGRADRRGWGQRGAVAGTAEDSLVLGATEGDSVDAMLRPTCSKSGFAVSPRG